MPDFYFHLIPDYIPCPEFINLTTGLTEIILGSNLLLGGDYWRSWSALGIVILLFLFIPSHVWLIQQKGCVGSFCAGLTLAWIRLLIIHPLLIAWAYFHHKNPTA